MIGHITRCEDTRYVGHGVLARDDIAFLVHIDLALEDGSIWFVPNGDKDALNGQGMFFAGFQIAQPQPIDCLISRHLFDGCIPDETNLGMLESAFLHNLAGAQAIAAMNDGDVRGIFCQEERLFHSGIAAANHCQVFAFEEEAIAGGTGADAPPAQARFAL